MWIQYTICWYRTALNHLKTYPTIRSFLVYTFFNLKAISTHLISILHTLGTSNENLQFVCIPESDRINGSEEPDEHAKKQ